MEKPNAPIRSEYDALDMSLWVLIHRTILLKDQLDQVLFKPESKPPMTKRLRETRTLVDSLIDDVDSIFKVLEL